MACYKHFLLLATDCIYALNPFYNVNRLWWSIPVKISCLYCNYNNKCKHFYSYCVNNLKKRVTHNPLLWGQRFNILTAVNIYSIFHKLTYIQYFINLLYYWTWVFFHSRIVQDFFYNLLDMKKTFYTKFSIFKIQVLVIFVFFSTSTLSL